MGMSSKKWYLYPYGNVIGFDHIMGKVTLLRLFLALRSFSVVVAAELAKLNNTNPIWYFIVVSLSLFLVFSLVYSFHLYFVLCIFRLTSLIDSECLSLSMSNQISLSHPPIFVERLFYVSLSVYVSCFRLLIFFHWASQAQQSSFSLYSKSVCAQ